MKKKLTIGYAGMMGTYSMMYAGFGSFISVFLLGNDFSNAEIGLCFSIANLMTVVLQPWIADQADRSKKLTLTQMIFLIAGAMGLCISTLLVFRGRTLALFIFYAAALGIHGLLQPLLNGMNFRFTSKGVELNYGVCRACGSIGYSVLSMMMGTLVEGIGIVMVPAASLIVLGILVLFTLYTSKNMEKLENMNTDNNMIRVTDEEEITLKDFVKNNIPLLIMNVGVMFLFIHSYIIGSYMLQIITPLGGTSVDMGRMFSVAAASEIPVMCGFSFLNRKFGAENILKFSMLGFVLKNVIMFTASSTWMIYLAQGMQLIGYGIFYPAMVQYLTDTMSKGEAVKGQSLFTMMITAAGMIANISGGVILDLVGVKMLMLVNLVTCTAGAGLIYAMVNYKKREAKAPAMKEVQA